MGWFGPSKEEVWQQLCTLTGAKYIDGGFWKGSKVQTTHGPWTITLDTYTHSHQHDNMHHTTTYTRFRAPYVNPDGFRFTIYREGMLSGIGKWLGMQDVEVGFAQFDKDFIIQGNNTHKLKGFFKNERIRQLLTAQPNVHFTVKDDEGWFATQFPQGVDELYFETPRLVTDLQQLRWLFDLFAETLEQLCAIQSAEPRDPGVML